MIITCPACEQKNRIPADKLGASPKCGACKTIIDYYAYPAKVGQSEFDAIIKHATGPVVVDFWSPNCGPCLMVAPELERFAAENPETLVLKVNTLENVSLVNRLNIRSIPTFHLYNNGELKKTEVGFMDAKQMGQKLVA